MDTRENSGYEEPSSGEKPSIASPVAASTGRTIAARRGFMDIFSAFGRAITACTDATGAFVRARYSTWKSRMKKTPSAPDSDAATAVSANADMTFMPIDIARKNWVVKYIIFPPWNQARQREILALPPLMKVFTTLILFPPLLRRLALAWQRPRESHTRLPARQSRIASRAR